MEYLGAWGTLIHEKNLKSKISCQTPFNSLLDSEYEYTYNMYYVCPPAEISVEKAMEQSG